MNRKAYAIGVDIGGTSTKIGIVKNRGTIANAGCVLATGMYSCPEALLKIFIKRYSQP
jgi:predicted NBD/HSP70 family sugar kinase